MGLKTVAVLVLLGTATATAQFMPRLMTPMPYDMPIMPYLRPNGCPSAPMLAPVICQFMEPNMGLFKPQLIAPSTYIPPLVVEKCDKPQLEIALPPKRPVVIPEAPILPPITLPKFPVPVIKPLPSVPFVKPAPVGLTSDAADVIVTDLNIPLTPALPPLETPALPEIVAEHGADMSEAVINDPSLIAPHPPAIPTFLMPEFPAIPPMIAPYPEFVPNSGFVQPLVPIPAAPELPPVRLPEIPVHVETPAKPMVPPMIFQQQVPMFVMPGLPLEPPMIAPCPEQEPIPVPIPELIQPLRPTAPLQLAPARLPEVPVLPHPMLPPMKVEEPCITGELIQPKPVLISHPSRIPEPMPIYSAHEPTIIADPCVPAIQPATKVLGHRYIVRAMPPYMPVPEVEPVLYPSRSVLPYMRRI